MARNMVMEKVWLQLSEKEEHALLDSQSGLCDGISDLETREPQRTSCLSTDPEPDMRLFGGG